MHTTKKQPKKEKLQLSRFTNLLIFSIFSIIPYSSVQFNHQTGFWIIYSNN